MRFAGQGISVDRLRTERASKLFLTNVYLNYRVQKSATADERLLSLQSNSQIASSVPVLKVAR